MQTANLGQTSRWLTTFTLTEEVQQDREFNLRCKISEDQYKILESIRCRNVERFKSIVNRGVSPNFMTDSGNSPIHVVTAMGPNKAAVEILKIMLYLGVPLDVTDKFGQTPLHIAAEKSEEMVCALLEAGAAVDSQDNAGRTALMHACASGFEDTLIVVHYLMDRNANVHLQDQDGLTALHCLCRNRTTKQNIERAEVAYKLLNAGLSATVQDKLGKMPLCHELTAILKRREKVGSVVPVINQRMLFLRALIKAGATFSHKSHKHEQLLQNALNLYCDSHHLYLLSEFEPVLSITSLKKILSIIPTEEDSSEKLVISLRRKMCEVQSLKFMCRNVIRTELKGKVLIKVEHLELPHFLKQYILLENEWKC